jgi:3-hydroxybutyryl-CoA dehydrogenase
MKTCVIGAGTMGHGIAQVFAQAGYEVKLVDVSEEALRLASARMKANLDLFVEAGLIGLEESRIVLSRIELTSDFEDLDDFEFATESVTEDLNVKQQIFRRLDALGTKDAILASNTSGLSITEIASVTKRPERVIGTNWWNPPHIIPLVEVMRGEKTHDDTVQRTKEVLRRVGKKPILVLKPIRGFIGNRLQIALLREALYLLENDVANAEDIDTAVSYGPGFRYPVLGPFKTADFGGLDVFCHLSGDLFKELDSSAEPQKVLARLVEAQKLGVKSGEGFYKYSSREMSEMLKQRDRKLLRILKSVSAE